MISQGHTYDKHHVNGILNAVFYFLLMVIFNFESFKSFNQKRKLNPRDRGLFHLRISAEHTEKFIKRTFQLPNNFCHLQSCGIRLTINFALICLIEIIFEINDGPHFSQLFHSKKIWAWAAF